MPRRRTRPRDIESYVDHTADCPLMTHSAPDGCDWCGADLPPGHRRWCSGACARNYELNHSYKRAKAEAKRKARRGRSPDKRWLYECERCEGRFEYVETNHIEPCRNMHNVFSCHHHLDNLEVLCEPCHKRETREQHARGELLVKKGLE